MTITAEYPLPQVSRSTSATTATVSSGQRSPRLDGIDVLRGLVIVLMALDHTRDFFSGVRFDPTDLTRTTTALFFTRWITHYCAPVFVLLAGVGAALLGRRRSTKEVSNFLLTRGIWLIVLEFTAVYLGWSFNLRYEDVHAQVIWAIGASMVVLAGMVWWPRRTIIAVALVLIAGHNLLDGLAPADFGILAPVWQVLHVRGIIAGTPVLVMYPLLPWIGVLAAGYLMGSFWIDHAPSARRHSLMVLGGSLIAGFAVLRLSGMYGEPSAWDPTSSHPFLSFLNTTKYPPSLLYLLMTLGPACLLLAWWDRGVPRGLRWLITFGRVPLFFYVIHLYVIHALAVAAGASRGYPVREMMSRVLPVGYGFGLPGVYLAWALVIATMYPLCRWYGRVKANGRGWWWGYL